jgi:2-amino-4-hydroxy-6-hydroxymethyldihydropteridine diphosphokinase
LLVEQEASSLYRTAPQFDKHQAVFWNAILKGHWGGSAFSLLERMMMMESRLGRLRDFSRPKGPRIIDLDLLLAGERSYRSDRLILPHAGLLERRFVLDPLAELEPTGRHPITGVLWSESGSRLSAQTVERSLESW